jgi:hypothetical protein
MMKRSGIVLCLWAMLALIVPATTAAKDDLYSLRGNDAEDEYEHKIYDGPYRGRRLAQRPGPFGKVLDNAGVQTWGAIPEVRSTYQETGEGETRTLWASGGSYVKGAAKGGKKSKGGQMYQKPDVTSYNYGKGSYTQPTYDYGKGKGKGKGASKGA